MQAIVVVARRRAPFCDVAAVARIPRGTTVNGFGIHVAFDAREMADELTGREPSRRGSPLQIVVAHAVDEAVRALVHTVQILEKRRYTCDFHRSPRSRSRDSALA